MSVNMKSVLIAAAILAFPFVAVVSAPREVLAAEASRSSLAIAVQKNLRGDQRVDHAIVNAGYALVVVTDKFTGGELVYAFRDNAWKKIGGGGGVAAANDLATLYKVPAPVARALVDGIAKAPKL